ncbi:MAG: Holliday junction resolvase RuvX [Bacteroidota bacterium]|nr:Holliday junction resolvase RuvX [Bacteroidota bacterium]
MSRILSIDYGSKRTGLAVTDPLQIIATGLTTVETPKLIPFLKDYFLKEQVEMIIIGMPSNWDDTDTHATPLVKKFILELKKNFPGIAIKEVDERYTSKLASQAMVHMGMKKKQRREKGMVDQVAATIMLQEYLQHYI